MKIKPSGNMSIRAFANNYKRNAKIYIYIYWAKILGLDRGALFDIPLRKN